MAVKPKSKTHPVRLVAPLADAGGLDVHVAGDESRHRECRFACHTGGVALPTFPTEPMRAVAGDLPHDEGPWAFEIKWDGMRILAFVTAEGSVRLQSSNGRDVTASFPELGDLAAATAGRSAVLDGEVVALDDKGQPSFARLQQRMHLTNERDVAARAGEVAVVFQIFDLLAFDGLDATGLAYVDRRRLLDQGIVAGPAWSVPAHHRQGGAELLAGVAALGLEGIMAKRLDSTYERGRRSRAWVKVKVRYRQEFVVGGWADSDQRPGRIGSLLVGFREAGNWRYAGRVGSGLREADLVELPRLLAPLQRATSPFTPEPPAAHRRGASWVEPQLVVEVAFSNWTADGRLRHPSYQGQRFDRDALNVTAVPGSRPS